MHNPQGLIIVLVLKDVCYLSRIEIEDVITNMPAVPACTEKRSKSKHLKGCSGPASVTLFPSFPFLDTLGLK